MFPTKKKNKLIDVDALIPKIDENDASGILSFLKSIENGTHDSIDSFQALYDTGKKQNQWIAEYAQSTQGQIRSTEGVIAANKAARDLAIQHNAALKAQTLGAKAATVGMKALAITEKYDCNDRDCKKIKTPCRVHYN